jgi:hypothetical protein
MTITVPLRMARKTKQLFKLLHGKNGLAGYHSFSIRKKQNTSSITLHFKCILYITGYSLITVTASTDVHAPAPASRLQPPLIQQILLRHITLLLPHLSRQRVPKDAEKCSSASAPWLHAFRHASYQNYYSLFILGLRDTADMSYIIRMVWVKYIPLQAFYFI